MTRTERARAYYEAALQDPYFKQANDPAFHLLGLELDRLDQLGGLGYDGNEMTLKQYFAKQNASLVSDDPYGNI